MKRSILLIVSTLLVAPYCFADSSTLVNQMKNNLKKMEVSTTSRNIHSSLIYGGQDIARPRIASAGDVLYPNQSAVLIG